MGTLRIHGQIDIRQFWPIGDADADTTKIQLLVSEDSFEYRAEGQAYFIPTVAFDNAISKGQGSKPVVKVRKSDQQRIITVRLQGVDAPELHYKAAPLRQSAGVSPALREAYNTINREERRQCYAQSSTTALARYLTDFTNEDGFLVDCLFQTEAGAPYEVIDTYGRFVGNILIGDDEDINLWLVANGWGLPTFYTSMSADEIDGFLTAWQQGKRLRNRPASAIQKDASQLDWTLTYQKPDEDVDFKIGDDKGRVLMPKIFRRQVAWAVQKKAGVITRSTTFQAFLKKTPDQLVLLDDFLENGLASARVCALHEFVDDADKILCNPEALVFQEKPGTLVDEEGNKIVSW